MLQTLTDPITSALGMPLSIGDLLGFVTGLLCVGLTARANIWNFPMGIVNSAILGLVFLQQRLFADASLQIVFIVLSARGWQQWQQAGQGEASPVGRASGRALALLGGVALVLTALLWPLLAWARGGAPLLDALITALSLCAQWLLNRRMLENWLGWIVVDLISIPLYWVKGLPLIALLYTLFLLICVQGWFSWRQRIVQGLPA